ncbi:thiol-disulfide isomerase/thioredoxin [Flagellimonas meridianipacifica]|uniref:Thiol-disulfide isomerase/thioredoxin n=2 Tax=Flagellimonas meridianipacifica TaxID=1080225 RepID=A0A2T0MEM8_9FLAO|nr:thiol-disulfide isomerase/thioredoxin [Allomuricauda pacifica]
MFCLSTFTGVCQDYNQEITMENGKKFMVGKITEEGLNNEPYQTWFKNGYESYMVDEQITKMFKKSLKKHDVKLFLGTWCGDSKREVPRVLKILKKCEFPKSQLEIVALDRRKEHYKKSPTGEEKGWSIVKVPTIIFLKDGKEVNRIVESPIESLEEDMAQILLDKPYTPNYAHLSKTK